MSRITRAFLWQALIGAAALIGHVDSLAAEPSPGQSGALALLTSAQQVRQLSPEEATRNYPVRLRGIVTFYDTDAIRYQFIQDDTAGIFFSNLKPSPHLHVGDEVEIEGYTDPGYFAPQVTPRVIRFLGKGTMPAPKHAELAQLASGQEDSQFVELRGIVRSAHQQSDRFLVDVATGGSRFSVVATKLPVSNGEDLVDSEVRVCGVCASRYNLQRQFFDVRLLLPRAEDLIVETPAPANPFAAPTRPILNLQRFVPAGQYGHRVKVSGTVTCQTGDNDVYIQDATEGLHIKTVQKEPLVPGDQVEVLGFPTGGEFTPMLQDAIFRKISSGPLPAPNPISIDTAMQGANDCRLVRMEGTVLERSWRSREQFIVLENGGIIFQAYITGPQRVTAFSTLQNGSQVAVTGVCVVEKGAEWSARTSWQAKSFRILLRSPEDITVRQMPSWWTLQRLLWAFGLLGMVVLAAFGWVASLRRRVANQTSIIRKQLQTQAALKDRYEELFENASDIVLTYDLNGKITSINRAGERLLKRPREQIVDQNLLDLLVADERPEAAKWLCEAVENPEISTAEWDFLNASGQRLKLELSTRVVNKDGSQNVECECIARDTTERKRLEKEILEVSNREQRRMGHDLHDGVCQQLVAMAYRADVLADQLRPDNEPASREAKIISRSLNEAIVQTRAVARGLFPVRLDENGLASALEELAANTADMFKIKCRFHSDGMVPVIENGVALHLYYIAREAVVNAANHGKPSEITISLTHAQDRFLLTVCDNGAGFQPSSANSTGMGIRIMRYRARVIGATLDLKGEPGQGTQAMCGFAARSRHTAKEAQQHDRRN